MRVLITGADGLVGRTLARRLSRGDAPLARGPLQLLLLLNQPFPDAASDPRVRLHVGDIADPRLLRRILADGVQCVFHLAGSSPELAERDPESGQRVNVGATLELFNQLREQSVPPVVVFASSIAVYGASLDGAIDESTPPRPLSSYGTQKLIGEMLLRDASRRDWIDGRILRLPAIMGATPAGQADDPLAACLNQLREALAARLPYVCPLPAQAAAWWMSASCCVDNLLYGAGLRVAAADDERTWVLPALRATVADVVGVLLRHVGEDRREWVRYATDAVRHLGGASDPILSTPLARAAGFAHDGDIDALVRRALLSR